MERKKERERAREREREMQREGGGWAFRQESGQVSAMHYGGIRLFPLVSSVHLIQVKEFQGSGSMYSRSFRPRGLLSVRLEKGTESPASMNFL